ncbi:MAG: 16S rRNA (uracil(1498)-N(3))-methyltransferase [Desulfobulbaceae bacterium]|jgi:RsmE family RNA methyltransferase|nr:16S rRNA (uracil(1498)-N(3))-methyltransferase [Desulfobulbaceae bacterium]
MNILLAEAAEVVGDMLEVTGNRANHIVKVLRACQGDQLRCGITNGVMGHGEIIALNEKHPRRALIRLTLNTPPPPVPPIDLVVALARPIMMRRLCSQLTSLGIGALHVIDAARVEKSFWQSSFIKEKQYLEHLRRGLEQAVDTRIPDLICHSSFSRFVSNTLPRLAPHYQTMILAHPGGSDSSLAALLQPGSRYLLFVGPEGGWFDAEIAALTGQGCRLVSLGDRILRVDTAAIALHARVSQLLSSG